MEGNDSLIWKPSPMSEFSAKACYWRSASANVLKECRLQESNEAEVMAMLEALQKFFGVFPR